MAEARACRSLGGQVQIIFEGITSSIGYVRAGKLRALAVTSATRSAALPDIPTVSEFVPSYEASGWFGIGAPKDTPPQIIEILNRQINAALVDTTFKTRIADLGGTPVVPEKSIRADSRDETESAHL